VIESPTCVGLPAASGPHMERLGSLAVATGGNRGSCDGRGNGEIKPKLLRWVATSCRETLMVRRGLRFESGLGLKYLQIA
jgi:hypothetical protein